MTRVALMFPRLVEINDKEKVLLLPLLTWRPRSNKINHSGDSLSTISHNMELNSTRLKNISAQQDLMLFELNPRIQKYFIVGYFYVCVIPTFHDFLCVYSKFSTIRQHALINHFPFIKLPKFNSNIFYCFIYKCLWLVYNMLHQTKTLLDLLVKRQRRERNINT